MKRFIDTPSPNFDERNCRRPVDMVVLHYTGMPTAEAALKRLTDPASKVSAHYCIDEDGSIHRLVPEDKRAWHAGVSFWRGVREVNARSIGIELVNPGHEFGYREFPKVQIDALLTLLEDIASRYDIMPGNYVGHSDIAPQRKEDPGELFPWYRLAVAGFGRWWAPDFTVSPHAPHLGPGDRGGAVLDLQVALDRIGYGIEGSGVYDTMTEAVVRAFQRHWRQSQIDGISDAETTSLIHHISEQVQIRRAGAERPEAKQNTSA
ncbi:N-acetylmuramoyl-L-alanine amidase [uncultured Ferrovibrio sp.]|mgnify:CR=1 FL=1|jgi:Negative regulator of beta-lactamase expression|uniref:peptidoglycan recognition protein family protein n=1 Tax=uncultured Ferrovibrio sp. TaxID=1576913 RepID=UPI00261F4F7D|nr:N-acetylmuramoyl-L-alanine amidase [uncultured Ferrovibrio sp.]